MSAGSKGCLTMVGFAVCGMIIGALFGHPGWGATIAAIISVPVGDVYIRQAKRDFDGAVARRYEGPTDTIVNTAYLGGHPEVRRTYNAGVLVIGRSFVAYLDEYEAPTEVFRLDFSRILAVHYSSDKMTLTSWASDMPFVLSETKEKNKIVGIAFMNDIGEKSVLAVSGMKAVADKLENAIYDWKKAQLANSPGTAPGL